MVTIYNRAAPVALGASGVTFATGIILGTAATYGPVELANGDQLYAIANTATTTLSIMLNRQ